MSTTTGGTLASADAVAGAVTGIEPGSTEARVLDAVVACAGRWGISKTTVDDVAREAGVSRATVYRLFPGGKTAMVHLTTNREVVAMLVGLMGQIDEATDLEGALTMMLTEGTRLVAAQPAVAYMRSHEPAALRAFFSFDRLDKLFTVTADVLAPTLHRFLSPADASATVIWCARLVLSHYLRPNDRLDLADRDCAGDLVRAFILPGLQPAAVRGNDERRPANEHRSTNNNSTESSNTQEMNHEHQ